MEHKIKIGKKVVKLSALIAILLHLMLIASAYIAINFDWLELLRKLHGG